MASLRLSSFVEIFHRVDERAALEPSRTVGELTIKQHGKGTSTILKNLFSVWYVNFHVLSFIK